MFLSANLTEASFDFTFQSGYIQIRNSLPLSVNILFFTFQSGYIQMVETMGKIADAITFTFQSGYIQMSFGKRDTKKHHTFTFQSGYIQMNEGRHLLDLPSTLHSNLVIFKFNAFSSSIGKIFLYIPIWLYSNARLGCTAYPI